MLITRFREFFTVTNFFTLICTSFTCILLVQVAVKYAIIKPTSTSYESAKLDFTTFPDVVVCVDPLFDEGALREFGYDGMSYFHGRSSGDGHFIGWNGMDGKHNSTYILNKALTGGMLDSVNLYFRDNSGNYSKPRVQSSMLLHPNGRCLFIKPPEGQMSFKHLFLWSNATKWSSDVHLNVFLMDPVNSPLIFPMDFQMKGDHIRFPLENIYSSFIIRASRSYHVEDDPAFDCKEYNQDLS